MILPQRPCSYDRFLPDFQLIDDFCTGSHINSFPNIHSPEIFTAGIKEEKSPMNTDRGPLCSKGLE
jgi:hypothetical protein